MMTRETANRLIPWFLWGLFTLILSQHIHHDHDIMRTYICDVLVDDAIDEAEHVIEGVAMDTLDDFINFDKDWR